MPWTCGKNTCPSRYTFFGKGCKRTLFRGLERATWTGYSNSKNRPLTLFEKEYYDPPPAYRRRPEITRMEAQTASARGYLKLPGRHPFPAAGGQRKGTSLRMSLSFGTPEGIRTSDLPLRRRSLYPAELQAHMKLWKNWHADALILYPNSPRLSTARGVFVPRFGRFFCKNQLRALLFYGIICGRAFNDMDRFRNKLRGAPLCKIRS